MLQQNKLNPPASLPARALTSLNALTHGGTAQTLFLPGENPDHFWLLLDDAFAHYQPSTCQDADLVTDSVQARWYLSRRQRSHSYYELQLHGEYPDPTYWPDASLNRLNLFDRYKTQAERALRRALTNVQAIRKDALHEQHWQELLALKKENLQLQLEKLEHRKAMDARPTPEQQAAEAKRATQRELRECMERTEASHAPIQSGEKFGGCVIVQHIHISLDRGATYIDEITPSNDKVRKIILQRESYTEPPQRVVRYFHFLDGIPHEYEFLIDEDNRRPIEDQCSTSYFLSFDEWETLAEKEDFMLSHQPKPADDSEEPYQN